MSVELALVFFLLGLQVGRWLAIRAIWSGLQGLAEEFSTNDDLIKLIKMIIWTALPPVKSG